MKAHDGWRGYFRLMGKLMIFFVVFSVIYILIAVSQSSTYGTPHSSVSSVIVNFLGIIFLIVFGGGTILYALIASFMYLCKSNK